MTKNVQTVKMDDVINAVFKATNNLGYINGKWWAQYVSHSDWIALASVKSGMGVVFPLLINITDSGAVELRTEEEEWPFFSHQPDEGCLMSDEMLDTLASVLEYELTSFISRYWARK